MSDPLRPLGRFALFMTLGVLGVTLVTVAGFAILASPSWTEHEYAVLEWLSSAHTAFLDAVAIGIAEGFGTVGALIVSAVLLVVVGASTRDALRTLTFGLTIGVCWGSVQVRKYVIERPRPNVQHLANPPDVLETFSYPSGHTAFAAALGLAVFMIVRGHRARVIVGVLAIALTIVVAFSRTYLGVHYPSDTIAAAVLVASTGAIFLGLWLRFVVPAFVVPAPWLRASNWR